MLSNHITIESFTHQVFFMKCMESIFIDYGLLQVFMYSFESPLCYGYSKTIHEIHTM